MLNLGSIFLMRDDGEQALVHYRHAEQLEPENANVLLSLAKAYHRQEEFSQATAAFDKLREASPRLAEKHAYLGSTDSEARAAEAGEEMMEWTDEE